MKIKAVGWRSGIIAFLALASSLGAPAQHLSCDKLSGQINAYTPQTSTTGPYEVRGTWSLKLKRDGGKADFYAALNMELSDGWVLTKNSSNFDPQARSAHTHHITLLGGDVAEVPGGFQVSGNAMVTLNGGPTPFPQISPVTIVITGGNDVEFSNIALTFQAPASNHFGGEPLSGVVRRVSKER